MDAGSPPPPPPGTGYAARTVCHRCAGDAAVALLWLAVIRDWGGAIGKGLPRLSRP
jgi:hypothetical protein